MISHYEKLALFRVGKVIDAYRHSTWEETQEVKAGLCYRVSLMQLGLYETWFKKRKEGKEKGRKYHLLNSF